MENKESVNESVNESVKESVKESFKECNICASNYTSYMRKAIKCEYCDFEACKECCSTYLLNVNKPGCMSPACTGEWSREFISDNLTKVFASTKLKQHKANMLYQEQLTWMQESQAEVEAERRQQQIRNKIYQLESNKNLLNAQLNSQIRVLAIEKNAKEQDVIKMVSQRYDTKILLNQLKRKPKNETINESIKTVEQRVLDYDVKIETLNKEFYMLRDKFMHDQEVLKATSPLVPKMDEIVAKIDTLRIELNEKAPAAEKAQFVRKCADPECNGFVSSRWKCGLCEKWTCSDCHEIKSDDDHKCDPDTLATAKLLSKDTKGCPKCQTMIYKIDGCDQMWCTQCHTAFSWKTGQIETKIHNPHYYQWRRQNGGLAREPGDIVCGNELNHELSAAIRNALLSKHYQTVSEFNNLCLYISDVVRNCLHLQYVIIPSFRQHGANQTFAQRTNWHRKAYLTKEYTLEKFKQQVERLDRSMSLANENEQVTTLLLDATKEILFRFKASAESDKCDQKILEEIRVLVKYANRCLMRIGVTYTTASVYHFSASIGYGMIKTDRKELLLM
jgi:hypothetical protein